MYTRWFCPGRTTNFAVVEQIVETHLSKEVGISTADVAAIEVAIVQVIPGKAGLAKDQS